MNLNPPRRHHIRARALGAACACAVAVWTAWPTICTAAAAPSTLSVAWTDANGDADIDRAFQQARSGKKPLLLYWGAQWCPPCNQLKATLFNRQDFIEQTRAFVTVHIDGDSPGAQKLGARFKVRGYPTLILFNPDGAELTRLPGEIDAPQVMQVMQLGLASGRPVKAVLADARAGRPLTANEWRLLGFYAWDVDQGQLIAPADLPKLLSQLATQAQSVDPGAATRLWLKALVANAAIDTQHSAPESTAQSRLTQVLGDALSTRALADVLSNGADDIVRTLAPQAGPARKALLSPFESALMRLEADTTLSRADRLQALQARVDLARLDLPKNERHPRLSPALVADVKEQTAKADRDIVDGYERQAVISAAAHLLSQVGLWADSDALLKANIAKSHSPYYLLSGLANNARQQGRTDEALRWSEAAFKQSEGPATRLQWGANYLAALVELNPKDSARIEKTAAQLFTEAGQDKGAFYERSARSLQKISASLRQWQALGQSTGQSSDPRTAALKRLKNQLNALCPQVDTAGGQRATCQALMS
ncbi:thioredoxin family protein [Roseateles koreensis]|uniref:Thioredoxin family protein n=1 Tax=Roseateles koreensis TaxID=2987526 RepID=A0ABT5KUD2_9BURK|nr:thioredoxin fold domain-containing protein [Roseateles koreensis]MDC8786558.1 thioredoxin family protein [Roseateles koreensis]